MKRFALNLAILLLLTALTGCQNTAGETPEPSPSEDVLVPAQSEGVSAASMPEETAAHKSIPAELEYVPAGYTSPAQCPGTLENWNMKRGNRFPTNSVPRS